VIEKNDAVLKLNVDGVASDDVDVHGTCANVRGAIGTICKRYMTIIRRATQTSGRSMPGRTPCWVPGEFQLLTRELVYTGITRAAF
jgi:hypothetical protein